VSGDVAEPTQGRGRTDRG